MVEQPTLGLLEQEQEGIITSRLPRYSKTSLTTSWSVQVDRVEQVQIRRLVMEPMDLTAPSGRISRWAVAHPCTTEQANPEEAEAVVLFTR
jgi:hypothetical protein